MKLQPAISIQIPRGFKSWKGGMQILIIIGLAALAACNANSSPQPTRTSPTPTQTALLIPTLAPTPTVVPTLRLPVVEQTPVPDSSLMISEENLGQLVELARWHKGFVTDSVFSPDGKTIGVASTVGIFLYAADTLNEILSINTDSKVNAIAFSPDGASLAGGLSDKTVKIWAIDGTLLHTLKAHTGYVSAVTYSPDAKFLASSSDDRTVNIWRTSDGSLIHTFAQDANPYDVIFSADGLYLFVGSETGTSMITAQDGKLIHLFRGHSIHDLAISKDGRILATYGTITLYNPDVDVDLWQISDGQELANIKGGSEKSADIESIALSSDGQYLVAGWGDGSVKIWSASNGTLQSTLQDLKPKGGVYYYNFYAVALSPDDNSLLMAGASTIGIWDIKSGTLLKSSNAQSQPIYRIRLSDDDRVLSSVEGENIRLLQMSNGQPITPPQEEMESNGDVAISPDGSSLAAGLFDGSARIWPLTEKGIPKSFEPETKGGYFTGVAFSPDSQVLALAASYPGNIEMRNVSDGSLLRTFPIGANVSYVTLAYSPDGEYLAASAADSVRLFRTADGKSLGAYKGGLSLAFSPDSKLIAGGALQDAVRVWEIATGKVILNLTPPLESVTSVVFSPDGKLLVSGGDEGTISIWNVSSGQLLGSWVAHSDTISGLIFTKAGNILISASYDGTIRLWGIKQNGPFQLPPSQGFSPRPDSGFSRCWLYP
jgi:WD40 repeat protein